jgi:hypothetical protein
LSRSSDRLVRSQTRRAWTRRGPPETAPLDLCSPGPTGPPGGLGAFGPPSRGLSLSSAIYFMVILYLLVAATFLFSALLFGFAALAVKHLFLVWRSLNRPQATWARGPTRTSTFGRTTRGFASLRYDPLLRCISRSSFSSSCSSLSDQAPLLKCSALLTVWSFLLLSAPRAIPADEGSSERGHARAACRTVAKRASRAI